MESSAWRRTAVSVCLTALAAGGVLSALGRDGAAAIAWAVGPALLLGPLTWHIVGSLRRRQPDVDVIALLALGGTLAAGEWLAGAIVAVMLTGGEALEDLAGERAERELTALAARAPSVAHVLVDGDLRTVAAADVAVGDQLVVRPGEQVPTDLRLGADATLDESTMTGESVPVRRRQGEVVPSGVVAVGAEARGTAVATAADSGYAAIVALVEEARRSKAPMVRLADRYAAGFVPLALLLAGGAWLSSGDPVRALAVLVVATPCPLLLATPIAVVSGISRIARHGVVVKHGGALEQLGAARTVCLDKTGTVTTGHPEVVAVLPLAEGGVEEAVRLAGALDQLSTHPFAPAIVAAGRQHGRLPLPDGVEEVPGEGVRGTVDGRRVAVGALALVADGRYVPESAHAAADRARREGRSIAFVAVDDAVAAALLLEDPLREEAAATIAGLRAAGVERTVLLSGDRQAVADAMGGRVGVDEVLAERSPAGKVEAVAAEQARAVTLMVGDGVNDAPALAAADVGVAMGARGAPASSQAASVVLTVDRIDALLHARELAVGTRRIARQSALVGMGLAGVAMVAAAAGLLSPVEGAVLQEAIDLAAIGNALRALRLRPSSVG